MEKRAFDPKNSILARFLGSNGHYLTYNVHFFSPEDVKNQVRKYCLREEDINNNSNLLVNVEKPTLLFLSSQTSTASSNVLFCRMMSIFTLNPAPNSETSSAPLTRPAQTRLTKKGFTSCHAVATPKQSTSAKPASHSALVWANTLPTQPPPSQMKISLVFLNMPVTAPPAPLNGRNQR